MLLVVCAVKAARDMSWRDALAAGRPPAPDGGTHRAAAARRHGSALDRLHEVAQHVLRAATVSRVGARCATRATPDPIRRRRAAGIPCRMTSCASLPAASASTRASPAAIAGSRSARSCARASRRGVALGARLPQAREPATPLPGVRRRSGCRRAAGSRSPGSGTTAMPPPTAATTASHSSCTQLAGNGARTLHEPPADHRRGAGHDSSASAAPRRATTRAVRAPPASTPSVSNRVDPSGAPASSTSRASAATRSTSGRAANSATARETRSGCQTSSWSHRAIRSPDAARERLLEVGRHAERHGVAQHHELRRRGIRGTARIDRPLGELDRAVAGGVVGQHDLGDRTALPEDAVELLADEPCAVVGAERDGDPRRRRRRHQRSRLRPTLSTPRNMPAMIVCAPSIISSAASTAVRTVPDGSSARNPRRPRRELPDRDGEADEEEGQADERAALEADALLEPIEVPRPRDAEALVLGVDLREDREQHRLIADHGERGEVDLARDVEADVAEDDRPEGEEQRAEEPEEERRRRRGSGTASAG